MTSRPGEAAPSSSHKRQSRLLRLASRFTVTTSSVTPKGLPMVGWCGSRWPSVALPLDTGGVCACGGRVLFLRRARVTYSGVGYLANTAKTVNYKFFGASYVYYIKQIQTSRQSASFSTYSVTSLLVCLYL